MIDVYDSEAIVKIYRLIVKKCKAIDKFIKNHALYFGPTTSEYDALDVYNNIIDLMERKNQLINLNIIIEKAINSLSDKDKKILLIKMNYDVSINELCGILDLKERTAFRRIETAYSNFAQALNNSKYLHKLEYIINHEEWIVDYRDEIKERRKSFKTQPQKAVNTL